MLDQQVASPDFTVIAHIDELSESPGRITEWARSFTADDPVVLIVAPGTWSPERVETDAPAVFASAGIGETGDSARVVVLSGPLQESDLVQLSERCHAVYGETEMSWPLATLPRVDADQLKQAVIASQCEAPPAEPVYVRTSLGGGITIFHRDTFADREVIRQVLRDHQYALDFLQQTGWPGIARVAAGMGAGRPPLIVDLGANIGTSAVYFKQTFPHAVVAAVEPEPENFQLLQRNTAGLDGVHSFQAAIASRPGTVDLVDPGKGAWAYQAGAAADDGLVVAQVQGITVDDVIAACGPAEPFLLKVDIEGAEDDLFSAGSATLERFPVIVIELHDRLAPAQETSRSFLNWHLLNNRDIHTVGEHIFSLSPALRSR